MKKCEEKIASLNSQLLPDEYFDEMKDENQNFNEDSNLKTLESASQDQISEQPN